MIQRNVVETIKMHILYSTTFFPWESCLFEMMWKKFVRAGQATHDNIIWHICFACWITNATDLHSEYVILSAFPWRQSLHRCMSVLHYTCIACLVQHLMWPFRRPAFSIFTLTLMVFLFHALLTHAIWNQRIDTAVVNNCPKTGK